MYSPHYQIVRFVVEHEIVFKAFYKKWRKQKTLQIYVVRNKSNTYKYNRPQIKHNKRIYGEEIQEQASTHQNVLMKKDEQNDD